MTARAGLVQSSLPCETSGPGSRPEPPGLSGGGGSGSRARPRRSRPRTSRRAFSRCPPCRGRPAALPVCRPERVEGRVHASLVRAGHPGGAQAGRYDSAQGRPERDVPAPTSSPYRPPPDGSYAGTRRRPEAMRGAHLQVDGFAGQRHTVTRTWMSVPPHRVAEIVDGDLHVSPAGFAARPRQGSGSGLGPGCSTSIAGGAVPVAGGSSRAGAAPRRGRRGTRSRRLAA